MEKIYKKIYKGNQKFGDLLFKCFLPYVISNNLDIEVYRYYKNNKDWESCFTISLDENDFIYDNRKQEFIFPNANWWLKHVYAEVNDFLYSLKYCPHYYSFDLIEKEDFYDIYKPEPIFSVYHVHSDKGFKHIDFSGSKLSMTGLRKTVRSITATSYMGYFTKYISLPEHKKGGKIDNDIILIEQTEYKTCTKFHDIYLEFEQVLDYSSVRINDNMMYYAESMKQEELSDKMKKYVHQYIQKLIEKGKI